LFTVIFEDEFFLVIDKPAGYTLIPGRGESSAPLREAITGHLGHKSLLVHRLDRGTSGVCVLAKTRDAQRALSAQFSRHTVEKEYHALVIGEMREDVFTVDAPLGKDRKNELLTAVGGRAAKEALTEFRVLECFRGYTLVAAFPRTGRTHQIRVHLEYAGHPCIVDPSYGGRDMLLLSEMKPGYKFKSGVVERSLMERVTLHSKSLSFTHPGTDSKVTFTAEYAKDFAIAVKQMRRWRSLSVGR
ncbi:MAG: RluA family pseudouridine synthase, partial [Planctomycetota bacterium]